MKKISYYFFLVAEDYRTTTSGWHGEPHFRRYDGGPVPKSASWLKEKFGGLPAEPARMDWVRVIVCGALCKLSVAFVMNFEVHIVRRQN